jgi:hypothetical protein
MPFLPTLWRCHRGTIKFNPPGFPEMMEETAPGSYNRRGIEFDLVH